VVDKAGYGFPSDVWSVGVVLLEVFNGLLGVDKDK
jgi:serine/threonine protein kinase